MTEQEKQILLVDLCARLPYEVLCKVKKYRPDIPQKLVTVIPSYTYPCIQVATYLYKPEEIQPYLRPMFSMTEEEFEMVCSMNNLTDMELKDRINFPGMFIKNYTIETFDLFNSHHLDYRGLIPMGLALEAPEGMYNTKTE